MSNFSKKDRDEAARSLAFEWEKGESVYDVVAKTLLDLKPLKSLIGQPKASAINLAGVFHHLQMGFRERAIAERIILNDPTRLAVGLATSARFGFLMAIEGGTQYSGGYDCTHVFDLLNSIAARDTLAINAFLSSFTPPFKLGHQSTALLCNAVYAALNTSSDALRSYEAQLRSRSESKFFRAMYDCLVAILDHSPENFASAINELIRGNRRQSDYTSMDKIVCLKAHAFCEICLSQSEELLAEVDVGASLPWDADFHQVISATSGALSVFDFTPVNPVLGRWLSELPATFDINELLSSL